MSHVQTAVQVMWQINANLSNDWDATEGAEGIHLAAHYGLVQAASQLIGNGTDPDVRDCFDTTPLMYAASTGRTDVVKLLLHAGANPAALCGRGRSALHRACQMGHVQVVRELTYSKKDIAINAPDACFSGWSALKWAAEEGNEANFETLLSRADIDVNYASPDDGGRTVLHTVSSNGLTKIVEILLSHPDIMIDIPTTYGSTPLILASSYGHIGVLELLLAKAAQIEFRDDNGGTALLRAVDEDKVGSVRLLMENGAHYLSKDRLGRTILHGAAVNGSSSSLRYLLEVGKGLDPNTQDDQGEAPLHDAARLEFQTCVRVLIESGARTDVLDNDGRSPVRIALEFGSLKTLPLLREARLAEIEKDGSDEAQLTSSINGGKRPSVHDAFEFQKPARQDTFDADFKRSVHAAVRLLNEDPLQTYLESPGSELEAKIDKVDNDVHQTPLQIAARCGKTKAVSFLLSHGADPNTQDMWGFSSLHHAAEFGYVSIVTNLLNFNATIDAHDWCKRTPLEIAMNLSHQPEMALLLIKRGAFVDKNSYMARRSLRWATELGDLDAVKCLVMSGVLFQFKDSDGLSAFLRAKRSGFNEIARFLFEEAEQKKLSKISPSSDGTTVLQDATDPKTASLDKGKACAGDTKCSGAQKPSWRWFGLGKTVSQKVSWQGISTRHFHQQSWISDPRVTRRECVLILLIICLTVLLAIPRFQYNGVIKV